MSILGQERAVLREAYINLDEALEYANSELNKATENQATKLARIYHETESVEAVIEALGERQVDMDAVMRHELGILLTNCYDLVAIMKEVNQQVEKVVGLSREVQTYREFQESEEEGRRTTISNDRPEPIENHRLRPGRRQMARQSPTPIKALGDTERSNRGQNKHPTKAPRNGRGEGE